jgi:hypothetical protein
MKALTRIVGGFFGLLIIAGAIAAFHFWQINGFVATMLGAAGVSLIGYSFGID